MYQELFRQQPALSVKTQRKIQGTIFFGNLKKGPCFPKASLRQRGACHRQIAEEEKTHGTRPLKKTKKGFLISRQVLRQRDPVIRLLRGKTKVVCYRPTHFQNLKKGIFQPGSTRLRQSVSCQEWEPAKARGNLSRKPSLKRQCSGVASSNKTAFVISASIKVGKTFKKGTFVFFKMWISFQQSTGSAKHLLRL